MHKKSLNLSLIDAFFFSIMVGAGESYLPAFGLSVGMGEALAGLFGIVPMICGAFIQLLTPWGIGYFKSIKRWVVVASAFQGLTFIPFVIFAASKEQNFFLLFFFAALYWGAGFAAGPTWNYWMGYLLPQQESSKFFSSRLKIQQLGIIVGLVGGGLALHYNLSFGPFTSVFSMLFLLAFLSRATSSLILSNKYYHPEWTPQQRITSMKKTFSLFFKDRFFRQFFSFLFVFYVVIFLSSPFVNPFFLKKIEMTYQNYMVAISILILAKALSMTFGQVLIDKLGLKVVFFIGCLGLSPLPGLWIFSHDLVFTFALQFVSGIFWGLFDVALSVLFFSKIKHVDKISVLTLFNLFSAAAMALGTLLGGKVLHYFGETWNAYYVIFVGGATLRTLCVLGFWILSANRDLLTGEEKKSTNGVSLWLSPLWKVFRS